ncbi:MAG TPA: ABC transporter permease [Lentisphaeria bacterium]|nr:MAG: ABC transporter permease [Lentisphaerae bacterium GWF2_38_69]HBM15994.1 ABC transporter permease [Lentisphaeria bacterium]
MRKFTLNFFFLLIWLVPFGVFCFYNLGAGVLQSLFTSYTFKVAQFTFFQAFLSTFIALAVALIPSNYISKSNSYISFFAESTIFIPFFFPAVSTVVAFSIIGNFPFLKPFNLLYTLGIIVVANVFYNSPIFVKYIGEALRNIPVSIIENACLEGAGSIRIFFRIKLPMVMPSLLKAFFLCFAFCFTNFAIVLGLGGIKFSTLEVEIATTLSSSMNLSKALGYGIIQFIILSFISFLPGLASSYESDHSERKPFKSSRFSMLFTALYVFFEFFIVTSGLIFAFYNFYTGRFDFSGIITLFSAGLNAYYPVLKSLIDSFILSTLTALAVVVLVYLLLKSYSRFTDWIVLSACGISNAFLGIVLVYMNIRYSIPYVMLVLCGYLIISAPIAYSFMYQHIRGFPSEIIEASKVDGASVFQIFKLIELPILMPVFITVFIQIFAIVFGEFTIAYTMQLINYFPTVPVVDYAMLSDRRIIESSILNGISVLVIITLFLLSEMIRKRYRNKI